MRMKTGKIGEKKGFEKKGPMKREAAMKEMHCTRSVEEKIKTNAPEPMMHFWSSTIIILLCT